MTNSEPMDAVKRTAGRVAWIVLLAGVAGIAIATIVFALEVVFSLLGVAVLVVAVLWLWWVLKRRGRASASRG